MKMCNFCQKGLTKREKYFIVMKEVEVMVSRDLNGNTQTYEVISQGSLHSVIQTQRDNKRYKPLKCCKECSENTFLPAI